jgi:proteic killer suppression protein
MIQGFRSEAAADVFNGLSTKEARRIPQTIWTVAQRKMDMVNAAHDLNDLRVPPGNRLEALKGDWRGYYSIRVNDQFRVVFRWTDNNAHDVDIMDYH